MILTPVDMILLLTATYLPILFEILVINTSLLIWLVEYSAHQQFTISSDWIAATHRFIHSWCSHHDTLSISSSCDEFVKMKMLIYKTPPLGQGDTWLKYCFNLLRFWDVLTFIDWFMIQIFLTGYKHEFLINKLHFLETFVESFCWWGLRAGRWGFHHNLEVISSWIFSAIESC